MSVLACDRSGCPEIMCDTMIDYYLTGEGNEYICYSCLSELERVKEGWGRDISPKELEERVHEFMDKSSRGGLSEETESHFKIMIRSRFPNY